MVEMVNAEAKPVCSFNDGAVDGNEVGKEVVGGDVVGFIVG